MPFTTHLQSLSSIHDALSSLKSPSQLQCLVRDAMGHILENCTIFNGCISLDTPFMREFCACVTEHPLDTDDDSCFGLFECLAVFFREKSLRMGSAKLAPTEQAVLIYFETSGHWSRQERTIVNEWYWVKLPNKLVEESLRGMSHFTDRVAC